MYIGRAWSYWFILFTIWGWSTILGLKLFLLLLLELIQLLLIQLFLSLPTIALTKSFWLIICLLWVKLDILQVMIWRWILRSLFVVLLEVCEHLHEVHIFFIVIQLSHLVVLICWNSFLGRGVWIILSTAFRTVVLIHHKHI